MTCLEALEAVMAQYPRSEWDRALKVIRNRRIATDRPERIHLSLAERNKLFLRYGGRCHICKELIDPRSRWHVDHVNAHLTGDEYNAERNLAPSHEHCNLEKSSKSIDQLSRESGKTYTELIGEEP